MSEKELIVIGLGFAAFMISSVAFVEIIERKTAIENGLQECMVNNRVIWQKECKN